MPLALALSSESRDVQQHIEQALVQAHKPSKASAVIAHRYNAAVFSELNHVDPMPSVERGLGHPTQMPAGVNPGPDALVEICLDVDLGVLISNQDSETTPKLIGRQDSM